MWAMLSLMGDVAVYIQANLEFIYESHHHQTGVSIEEH